MSTVTNRIKEVKQPRGGYLKLSSFTVNKIDDGCTLAEKENINPSIVGMAVDYLTRFAMGAEPSDAFDISLRGAENAKQILLQNEPLEKAYILLSAIEDIDEQSIISACKLVSYDAWFRNPEDARFYAVSPDDINPNVDTIQNIKTMVLRSVSFLKQYGPVVASEFTFEPHGYTNTVNAGDGDYLTKDTLWDFKVSKNKPTSIHTLQILVYWIMGQHSGQKMFKTVKNIGIFNPRLNEIYLLNIKDIPSGTIAEIEKDVICF